MVAQVGRRSFTIAVQSWAFELTLPAVQTVESSRGELVLIDITLDQLPQGITIETIIVRLQYSLARLQYR